MWDQETDFLVVGSGGGGMVAALRAHDLGATTIVIEKAVDELTEHVLTLVRRLEPWPAPPEVAFAGGLIEEDGPLRPRMILALEGLPCRFQDRALDGARGACSLAMDLP